MIIVQLGTNPCVLFAKEIAKRTGILLDLLHHSLQEIKCLLRVLLRYQRKYESIFGVGQ